MAQHVAPGLKAPRRDLLCGQSHQGRPLHTQYTHNTHRLLAADTCPALLVFVVQDVWLLWVACDVLLTG